MTKVQAGGRLSKSRRMAAEVQPHPFHIFLKTLAWISFNTISSERDYTVIQLVEALSILSEADAGDGVLEKLPKLPRGRAKSVNRAALCKWPFLLSKARNSCPSSAKDASFSRTFFFTSYMECKTKCIGRMWHARELAPCLVDM